METTDLIENSTVNEAKQESASDLDQSFHENPYRRQDNETKVTIENQFETGEGYIPRSTVAKAEKNDFDTVNFIKATDKSLYAHCLDFVSSL